MSNQVQFNTFNFHSNAVRVIIDSTGELWFCGTDVCDILGYINSRDALKKHCKQGGVAKRYTPTTSGNQEMIFINEPNLYRLIIKSRKPEAERFEAWVFEEVLPQIRKTGSYGNQEKLERASKMAAVVAAQVSHDTFKAFMQGKDEELSDRWLVYTHWQNGKPEVGASPIPGTAHIATLEELADRIVQRDAYIFTEPEVLAKLANACLNKLAVRLQQIRK